VVDDWPLGGILKLSELQKIDEEEKW